MEDVKILEFLKIENGSGSGDGYGDGYGSGDGYGDGYGYGSGDGYGDGYGSGDGDGSGYGSGYGSGDGDGDGYGYGYGYGSGSGSGYGSGSGSGYGSGYGIKSYNGQAVYKVDDVPTLIDSVRHGIARGSILNRDLTLTPCYIVKQNNLFAHGTTLREAQEALLEKLFDDMPEEERIEAFVKEHPDNGQAYPNRDLFDWHHRLTGSCEMGRNAFVKNHGLDLDGSTTVQDFILLTEHDYGGSIIKKLRQYYKMEA